MSLIGNKPIQILPGIAVTIDGSDIKVSGPKGNLSTKISDEVSVKVENGQILVTQARATKQSSALQGTARSLINNMVKGAAEGYEIKMELVGVGYRAKLSGSDTLQLTVGYSHPVDFKLPADVKAEVIENTTVILRSSNKQLLGQIAANLRKIRKPEPYKGKGIKYATEVVRRKQGKSGKV